MELSLEAMRGILPARPKDGHKGRFGHLFVIAGSRGFTGAARLVCEAALRSGVGLVTAGVPHPLADCLAAALLEAMSLPLHATDAESISSEALAPALRFAQDKSAVAIGPGLSVHPDTVAFVREFVSHCPAPLVIDADALNALRESPATLRAIRAPCILTPHPGEMARLTASTTAAVQSDREGCARHLAQESGCVVALKGYRTVIAAPDGEVAINTTGGHGLAKGGTGDVLTGLVGGLLAQEMPPFDAACLAVFVHGLAGDLAAARFTARGMTAGDALRMIPAAWKKLEG